MAQVVGFDFGHHFGGDLMAHVSIEADGHRKHVACLHCVAYLPTGWALCVHKWSASTCRVGD